MSKEQQYLEKSSRSRFRRPAGQLPVGVTTEAVTFERDRTAPESLPRWFERLLAANQTEDELLTSMTDHIRRAPTHENFVLLGTVINSRGKRSDGGTQLGRVLTRDLLKFLRRRS